MLLMLAATLGAASAGAYGISSPTPDPVTDNGQARGNSTILNQATFSGDDGAGMYSQISNTVTLRVQEVVGVTVSVGGQETTTPAAPGSTAYVVNGTSGTNFFTVTNTGNTDTNFSVSATDTPSAGSTTQPSIVYVDYNGNGSYDAGEDASVLAIKSGEVIIVSVETPTATTQDGGVSITTQLSVIANPSQTGSVPVATDDDNYAATTILKSIGASLSPDQNRNLDQGTNYVFAKTVTNLSNLPLDASNYAFSSSETVGPNSNLTFDYQVGDQTTSWYATPQLAWEAYTNLGNTLARGGVLDLRVRASLVKATAQEDAISIVSGTGLQTGSGPSTDQILSASSAMSTAHEQIFTSNIIKQQAVCSIDAGGQSVSCGVLGQGELQVKPCDLVYYDIRVHAPNNGPLSNPQLEDGLSPALSFISGNSRYAASEGDYDNRIFTSQLIQINGGPWKASAVAGDASASLFNLATGGYDNNTTYDSATGIGDNVPNGAVDNNDVLRGGVFQMRLITQVKGNGAQCTVPSGAVNFIYNTYEPVQMI